MNKMFDRLECACDYVNDLMASGLVFQASQIFESRYKSSINKINPHLMLVGVDKKTENFCRKIAPGGKWSLEIEKPQTPYFKGFNRKPATTSYYRACAWYNKYLPYAVAMTNYYDSPNLIGIDLPTIKVHYGSCVGYKKIVEANTDDWKRIDPEDVELYKKILETSNKLKEPQFLLDEIYSSAFCYVAVKAPKLFSKFKKGWWGFEHIQDVFKVLNLEPF